MTEAFPASSPMGGAGCGKTRPAGEERRSCDERHPVVPVWPRWGLRAFLARVVPAPAPAAPPAESGGVGRPARVGDPVDQHRAGRDPMAPRRSAAEAATVAGVAGGLGAVFAAGVGASHDGKAAGGVCRGAGRGHRPVGRGGDGDGASRPHRGGPRLCAGRQEGDETCRTSRRDNWRSFGSSAPFEAVAAIPRPCRRSGMHCV